MTRQIDALLNSWVKPNSDVDLLPRRIELRLNPTVRRIGFNSALVSDAAFNAHFVELHGKFLFNLHEKLAGNLIVFTCHGAPSEEIAKIAVIAGLICQMNEQNTVDRS